MVIKTDFQDLPAWKAFIKEYVLSDIQMQQFAQYLSLLQEYNERFNLTTITTPESIIAFHFRDSLAIRSYIESHALRMLADVGSGAGFPGIPLKILFPHLPVILIEVNHKKIEFLATIIQALGLANCRISDLDWRTFLRKTNEPIDLFVSRAALHTDELMRMFKPSCIYNNRILIYWASKDWQMSPLEQPFFEKEEEYTIKQKQRRLIFFKRLHL